mmetsp:Transcript_28371/g.68149  ORF Transcript_28371/g.68149 Transcript_28371/m.68149 type:complete len:284 (-) Transcript_28371:631-1482(-)
MPPLAEVALKRSSSPVAVVATNLTLVLNTQPVQLVEPEGDRLPVPAHGQIQRVVHRAIFVNKASLLAFLIWHLHVIHLLFLAVHGIQLQLLSSSGLLLFQMGSRRVDLVAQHILEALDAALQVCQLPIQLFTDLSGLALLLKGLLPQLLNRLFVILTRHVCLLDILVGEQAVGGQHEQGVFVGGLCPALHPAVLESLLKILLEVLQELVHVGQRATTSEKINQPVVQLLEILQVASVPVLAVSRNRVELVEYPQPSNVINLLELRSRRLSLDVNTWHLRVLLA